jgi:recombinational DNA repair ATPase RecF
MTDIEPRLFYFKEVKMLTDAFNERIRVTIGENDLNMLSNNQVAELIKRYEKLLKQKNGQLDEISYEDIIAVWDKLQK